MRTEHHYRWRITWAGRKTTTRHHCTEADIRIEHPEAVAVPGSLIVREIPETLEERAACTPQPMLHQLRPESWPPGTPGHDLAVHERPTLLRIESAYPPEERVIPGSTRSNRVERDGDDWVVRNISAREPVYRGPGPVSVVQSPAPF